MIFKLNMGKQFYYFWPCCTCLFHRWKWQIIQKPFIKLDIFINDWSLFKQTHVYYLRTKINMQERYSCFKVYKLLQLFKTLMIFQDFCVLKIAKFFNGWNKVNVHSQFHRYTVCHHLKIYHSSFIIYLVHVPL